MTGLQSPLAHWWLWNFL